MRAIKTKFAMIANVTAILFSMASLLVFMWAFNYVEQLYLKIPVTLLAIFLPLLLFYSIFHEKSRARWEIDKARNALLWLSIPFFLLIIGLSHEHLARWILDIPTPISLIILLVFLSAPIIWLYWKIAKREAFLVAAIVLTVGSAILYLALPIIRSGPELEVLILVIIIVLVLMYYCVPLVLASRWFLGHARRSRPRPLLGPAMESLAMLLPVMPLILLTVVITDALTEGEVGIVVVGIVVGFLLTSTIAPSFGRFLRALGRFDEHQGE